MKNIYVLLLFSIFCSTGLMGQFSTSHYLPVSVSNISWSINVPTYRLTSIGGDTVTVTVKNAATGATLTTLSVPPNTSVSYTSPYKTGGGNGGVGNLGIFMEGDGLFSVTGIGDPSTSAMGFSWVSKGDAGLGTEFRVFAPSNNFKPYANDGNYYSVISTANNCELTFSGFPSGDTTVVLGEGQTYVFDAGNSNDEAAMMAGKITATKPIAVLNQTIQFFNGGPTAAGGGSEDGADMIVPINIIGDEYFITMGGSNDPIVEYVTVVGAFDNTQISVNGAVKGTIDAGEHLVLNGSDWTVDNYMEITGSQNFYTWHKTTNANASQDGYLIAMSAGCSNEQTEAILPVGNYSGATISVFVETGGIVSIDGTTLTSPIVTPNFDIYRTTAFSSDVVRTVISDKPLFINRVTYAGQGATGETYGGWTQGSTINVVNFGDPETDPNFDIDNDGFSDFTYLEVLPDDLTSYQFFIDGQAAPQPGSTLIIYEEGNYEAEVETPAGCIYRISFVGIDTIIFPPCQAGLVAPDVPCKLNNCPSPTIDLTQTTAANDPSMPLISLQWHTIASPASDSSLVSDPTNVSSGTYYAVFFDEAAGCYSPSSAVAVTITGCVEICDNGLDDDGDSLVDCADEDCDRATYCPPPSSCTKDTADFSFSWVYANTDPNYESLFLLADTANIIQQTATDTFFTNVSEGVFLIYEVNYLTVDGISGASVGQNVSNITGGCFIVTGGVPIKVCLPPAITSPTTATFAENATGQVYNTESTDGFDTENNGLTYAFTGDGTNSPDESIFNIDPVTGEITFVASPDFETPTDANTDNVYQIEVQVCDSELLCDTEIISITVTDVDEDGDGLVGPADPDDSDPCVPDNTNTNCCEADAPVITKD